ncbi:glycosyltransferase [bacterium SCSIO 12741]|nr:glycosyltransferase [bacterium SCSIO 12741]
MIAVVAPCFNEQLTITTFLERLESVLSQQNEEFIVVIVDDCSQDNSFELLSNYKFKAANVSYSPIRLTFNMGHQGAIYNGLLHAHDLNCTSSIIMDSDGEDDPGAIPLLLAQKDKEIVVVGRGKRSEGFVFRFSYIIYKLIFKLITNQTIKFGNYCLIQRNIMERIKHTSFIHLPAYLLKQKASKGEVIYNRSKRIDGKSKLGYKGLLMHAFKSMIEFGEDLLMLFLKMFAFIMVIFVVVLGNIIYQKFVAHTAILGWFSTLALGLLTLATLCIGFFIIGLLLLNLIHQQNNKSLVNYKEFIRNK